jgi:hypothetical protein
MGNENSTYCIITYDDLKDSAGIDFNENIICTTCKRMAKQHRPQLAGGGLIKVPWEPARMK